MTKHGAHAAWVERKINPHPAWPNVAIASLDPIPAADLADPAAVIAAARWQARPYETFTAFRDRIIADLAAENVTGQLVTIYEHGGFWHGR
jgi:hypothetical protein